MSWEIVIGCLAYSQQRTSSQITCCTASCSWLWICSTKPPYLQSRPHSQWLLSVQKSKILSSWNPVCRWWIAYSCCWSVVLGTVERILFSRNKQLSRKVTKLHWCCRKLYSKMTVCLNVCGSLLYKSCKTFWTPLVHQFLPSSLSVFARTHRLKRTDACKTIPTAENGWRAVAMTSHWRARAGHPRCRSVAIRHASCNRSTLVTPLKACTHASDTVAAPTLRRIIHNQIFMHHNKRSISEKHVQ